MQAEVLDLVDTSGKERSERRKKLLDFFEKLLPDLDEGWDGNLAFVEIELATEIPMNKCGKDLVRRVLRSMNIEYHPLRGYGIQLNNPGNVNHIAASRYHRVRNAARRFSDSIENTQKYVSKMSSEEQQKYCKLQRSAWIFNAITGQPLDV